MTMKRKSWQDYQKEIADDHYYYARSCIRQNFFPGKPRQHQIQQNQVRSALFQKKQGFRPRISAENPISLLDQNLFHNIPDIHIIIYNQNLFHIPNSELFSDIVTDEI